MHTARMHRALVAAVIAAAGLVGCGGSSEDTEQAPAVSSDERAILSTVDALQTASRRGDADAICDELFTETLAKSISDASKRSCAEEVRKTLTSPDAQISVARAIEVNGTRATATVREQDGKTSTLFLVKEEDRWRIDRIEPVAS